jgi:hypothetical protein
LTGFSRAEVLGRNSRFLQGDDRDQPGLTEIRQALAAGKGCIKVMRNYRKDGAMFLNELVLSPVNDEDGKLVHFTGIQQQVTGVPPLTRQNGLRELAGHDLRTPLTTIKCTFTDPPVKRRNRRYPVFTEKSFCCFARG